MLFFQDLESLTEVLGGTSAGMSGPKLPLWAEFSFLIHRKGKLLPFSESPDFKKEKIGVSSPDRPKSQLQTLRPPATYRSLSESVS